MTLDKQNFTRGGDLMTYEINTLFGFTEMCNDLKSSSHKLYYRNAFSTIVSVTCLPQNIYQKQIPTLIIQYIFQNLSEFNTIKYRSYISTTLFKYFKKKFYLPVYIIYIMQFL